LAVIEPDESSLRFSKFEEILDE